MDKGNYSISSPLISHCLKESLRFTQREGGFAIYRKDDVIPSITLPDVSGRTHTVHYGSQFVLIHIWSTRCMPCWADIEALNEFANPAPESLSVVTVAVDDTSESLDQFTKLHPVQVVNLMGGGWESKFANDFNIIGVPTDVLVDTDGHVIRRCWCWLVQVCDKAGEGLFSALIFDLPVRP